MFSNIDDAWNNDPIHEMTTKYAHKKAKENDSFEKIFDFKSNNNSNTINGSETSAVSLSNLNTTMASSNASDDMSLFNNSDIDNSDPGYDSKCLYSVKHLKKCKRCTNKLNKIIETKMQDKLDRVILDMKITQLQNNTPVKKDTPVYLTNSTKELMVILIGVVLAILLVFLIIKSF